MERTQNKKSIFNIFTLIIAIAIIAYFVLPVDVIPDIIPFLGWLDDVIVLIGGIYLTFKGKRPMGVLRSTTKYKD